jgi:hypothetical protein
MTNALNQQQPPMGGCPFVADVLSWQLPLMDDVLPWRVNVVLREANRSAGP